MSCSFRFVISAFQYTAGTCSSPETEETGIAVGTAVASRPHRSAGNGTRGNGVRLGFWFSSARRGGSAALPFAFSSRPPANTRRRRVRDPAGGTFWAGFCTRNGQQTLRAETRCSGTPRQGRPCRRDKPRSSPGKNVQDHDGHLDGFEEGGTRPASQRLAPTEPAPGKEDPNTPPSTAQ